MDGDRSQTINAAFEEVTADRAVRWYVSWFRVTFILPMEGANVCTEPAEAMYSSPEASAQNDPPYPATLTGTWILP